LPDSCELRQNKYLNNLIEQDHRFIKKLINPGLGLGSFHTAQKAIKSYEVMQRICKGQVQGVAKGAIKEHNKFIAQIFGFTV